MGDIMGRKPKAIVLDYDDTIVDFVGFLCEVHNKKHNTCITPRDITSWGFESLDFKDVRGNRVTGEQFIGTFMDYESDGFYVSLDLIGSTFNALMIMKELGYKIIILTARPDKFGKQTELNIIKNKIANFIDEVHMKAEDDNNKDFKSKKLKELSKKYNIQMFADDKYDTIVSVLEKCNINNVVLVDRGYSINDNIDEDDGIIKVNEIMETLKFLKKVK